ncbi:Protein ALP1-like [Frankliniella fusca]|uniref:Protein ALP1-like n=1 Tax=Frankliniella fusca TaxID=407009 RepID=A0AAE1HVF8_9NEOP|nr:Protein ALP1-like [Frankliniella fusca]
MTWRNRLRYRSANYHGTFSTVLLAACDADYRFTYVHIGAAGRESDSGIFQQCEFGQQILNGMLPLPPPLLLRSAPGVEKRLPAVFVGDAAFPLLTNLMRPYGGVNLSPEQKIFNYRLSRALRIIENTFGIMAARFQIFRGTIQCCLQTLDRIVMCCVVLHNWLRTQDILNEDGHGHYATPDFVDGEDRNGIMVPGQWRNEVGAAGMRGLQISAVRNATDQAKEVRSAFTYHFMKGGSIPFQWYKLPEFQRDYYMQRRGAGEGVGELSSPQEELQAEDGLDTFIDVPQLGPGLALSANNFNVVIPLPFKNRPSSISTVDCSCSEETTDGASWPTTGVTSSSFDVGAFWSAATGFRKQSLVDL